MIYIYIYSHSPRIKVIYLIAVVTSPREISRPRHVVEYRGGLCGLRSGSCLRSVSWST